MRRYLFCWFCLLATVLSNPNYQNPANSDLNLGLCENPSIPTIVKSPVYFGEVQCGGYNNFVLSMQNVAGAIPQQDGRRGSYIINYNGAKLQVDGESYTSRIITFRYQSEHILPEGRSALEMQIEMDNDNPSGIQAVLSFLIKDIGDDPNALQFLEYYKAYNRFKIIQSLDPQGWVLNLEQIGQRIQAKISDNQFLNVFNYDGTLTYSPCDPASWYVYGAELYAPTSSATEFTPGNPPNVNSRPISGAGGGGSSILAKRRLCFKDYFFVTLADDYGLWFGVVIIVLFFIFTLFLGEKPIKNPDYKENVWTIHPLFSIFRFGNEIHTRKARSSLLLVAITINALFSSVWYRISENKMRGSNTIVFAVYSMLISLAVSFMVGNLLREYYLAKHRYYQSKDEAQEQKAQNYLFIYYAAIFAIVTISWPFTVWNMNELHAEVDQGPSNMWVASFFIGIGLELLIIYPIICLLATKIGFIRKLMKREGYMYDDICHKTYLDYLKQD